MAALGSWRRSGGGSALALAAVMATMATVGVLVSAAAGGVAVATPGAGTKPPAASAPAKAKVVDRKSVDGEWVGFADLDGAGELLKAKVENRGRSVAIKVIGLRLSDEATWTLPGEGFPGALGKSDDPRIVELTPQGKLKVSFLHHNTRLTGLLERAGDVGPAQYARPRTWPLEGRDDQKVYLSFELAIKKAQHYRSVDALPKTDAGAGPAARPATQPATGPASGPASSLAGEDAEPVLLIRPMEDEVLEPRGARGRSIWPEIGCLIVPGKRVDYWDPPQRVIEIVQKGKSYTTAVAKTFDTRERLQKLAFSWVRPQGKEFTGPCEAYIYFRQPKEPFRILSNIIKVRAKFVSRRDGAAPE
jgi:hypothetical protein